jgi:ribosomal protein S18 acetylase RimI-like enzyme
MARLLHISLGDAKLLVHSSRAWSDVRERDEAFEQSVVTALEQLDDQEIITKLVIRPATRADFDQVGQIFTQELAFHTRLLPDMFNLADPIMTHEWYDDQLTGPDQALFVAELEEIVGVLQVEIRTNPADPIFKTRRYAYVVDLVVAEGLQGRRIGRLLMDRAREWATEQGASEIELQVWELNTRAIRFYDKLGYETRRRTMRLALKDI